MSEVIGFIGAGQMGEPMVHRLLAAGHEVLLYARRPEVRERMVAAGARAADSVAEVSRHSDVLILCVFSDSQLTEIASGPEGVMANASADTVVVSHTTGTVGTLRALIDAHPDGPIILDGPVSGSAEDIAAGKLTVLIGGPDDAVATAERVVRAYAEPVLRTGPLGTALNLKLVNNLLFAANAQLAAAATELGSRLGIGSAELLSSIAVCSGRSYALGSLRTLGDVGTFDKIAGPFLRKDVDACVAAAADEGVELGWLRTVVADGPLALHGERAEHAAP